MEIHPWATSPLPHREPSGPVSSAHMAPPLAMAPLNLFKLGHYIAHTSISKRVVGTRLKGLVVAFVIRPLTIHGQ